MYLFVLFQNGEFCLLESNKKGIWEGWGDSLVNKVQVVQAGRLKLGPTPHTHTHSHTQNGFGSTQCWNDRDRRIPGASWSAGPANVVSSMVTERHCLISWSGKNWRDDATVKKTCCSSQRPGLESQHPNGYSLLSTPSVPGALTLSFRLLRHQAHCGAQAHVPAKPNGLKLSQTLSGRKPAIASHKNIRSSFCLFIFSLFR